jgi:hypothetical protein
MKIFLLLVLVGIVAIFSVAALRRRREQRRAERAKALRAERLRKLRRPAPHVSANACGTSVSSAPPPRPGSPLQRPPPSRAA